MSSSYSWLRQFLAVSLTLLLAAPLTAAAATPLPSAPQPATTAASSPAGTAGLPPAPTPANAPAAPPQAASPAPQTTPTQGSSSSSQQQQTGPLGTAAAPVLHPGGVPASRPAGAAIAPAKQRRIRTIAIRVGLLVGAAIAIGAVAAASEGSPARPR